MLWIFLAFLTAISLSTLDVLSKKALAQTDELVIAWVREGYALPFLALGLVFVGVPKLDPTFFLTVLALLPLEVLALILYVKAIKLSPLSLSVPFMALSPVFIVFIAFVFLNEVPGIAGVIGIALIALGAYLLNASASRYGLSGPLKAAFKEPGSLLMIAVAFIYSITSTLGKVALKHSSPAFFAFFYPFVLSMALFVVVKVKGKAGLLFSRPRTFIVLGFFAAIMIISHFAAISMAQVAYVISVKRTSLVFSVLLGRLVFKEANIKERLLGCSVMLAGVFLIVFFE